MILQALVRHYEDLAAQGKVARPGWGPAKVSYALSIDDDGALLDVLPLKVESTKGKKTVLAPRIMDVPMPVKRAVAITPNFLCDNSGYILGIDNKGKPQRTLECFAAARELHLNLLKEVDAPAAQAVCAFFSTWDPAAAAAHPALQEYLEDICAGTNLVFWYSGNFVQVDSALRAAWQAHYDNKSDRPVLPCLVTGGRAPVTILHPTIKGIYGAQSVGASLVSFNATALESYGHEMARNCGQGLNAPVSEYAAFAYGAALNHLLSDPDNPPQRIGDTTVVCWAEGGESAYQAFACGAIFGPQEDSGITIGEVRANIHALAQGLPVVHRDITLKPDQHFYILGLAPNAARLSVRFFFQDDYGPMMQHLDAHYRRLEIVRPAYDKVESLTPSMLLSEVAPPSKKLPKRIYGDLLSAIIFQTAYPILLIHLAHSRIDADKRVTRARAAILKAYMIQQGKIKEGTMDKESLGCTEPAYLYGKLFALYEQLQFIANPNVNANIHDSYFDLAKDAPKAAFERLDRLARVYMRQAKRRNLKKASHLDHSITNILKLIPPCGPPNRFDLDQRNMFILGYYHKKTWNVPDAVQEEGAQNNE